MQVEAAVIDKIRKLRALAERGGTEHEGALAAALLQDLCRKHNIDPARLFGEKRATRKFVTQMRFETERKVYESRSWTQEIEHIYGPCLACEAEIEYTTHGWRGAKEWIKEQFDPKNRQMLLKSLERGRTSGSPSLNMLKNVLCEPCGAKFAYIHRKRKAELELKRKEKEERRQKEWAEEMRREEWSREWRKPSPAEFKRTIGRAVFAAVSEHVQYEILFRWRISNRCKCRGKDPGAAVGMWVNGELIAHYYGWDLTADEKDVYESEYQDRFGKGFELWFERRMQDHLLRANPDLSWSVLERELMPEVEKYEAWLVHIVWHNGQKYAKVGPLATIAEATKFAASTMGLRILKTRNPPRSKKASRKGLSDRLA